MAAKIHGLHIHDRSSIEYLLLGASDQIITRKSVCNFHLNC